MRAIPAASIAGVNLDRIRSVDPAAATEIERIDAALTAGTNSDGDVLELCGLLLRHGEDETVAFLLAASEVDSEGARMFRANFPDRVSAFDGAIEAFRSKYGLAWGVVLAPSVLHRICTVAASPPRSQHDDVVGWMLHRPGCRVELRQEHELVADVSVEEDVHAIPMVHRDGDWEIDVEHVGARWIVQP